MLPFCVISAVAEILVFAWISKVAAASKDSEQGILRLYLPHGSAFILSAVAVSSKIPFLIVAALGLNILVIAYLLRYKRVLSRQSRKEVVS